MLEIDSALDSLSPRDEASLACEQLAIILARRLETSTAVMLNDRLGRITGALDRLRGVVADSLFVSHAHEIAVV